MANTRIRRQFTTKFKRARVAQMEEKGVGFVEKKFKIYGSVLRRWREELGTDQPISKKKTKKVKPANARITVTKDVAVFARDAHDGVLRAIRAGHNPTHTDLMTMLTFVDMNVG